MKDRTKSTKKGAFVQGGSQAKTRKGRATQSGLFNSLLISGDCGSKRPTFEASNTCQTPLVGNRNVGELLQKKQTPRTCETPCLERVEVDSTRQVGGIQSNLMATSRLHFVNETYYLSSENIIDLQIHM